jgi:hypothetical protein
MYREKALNDTRNTIKEAAKQLTSGQAGFVNYKQKRYTVSYRRWSLCHPEECENQD